MHVRAVFVLKKVPACFSASCRSAPKLPSEVYLPAGQPTHIRSFIHSPAAHGLGAQTGKHASRTTTQHWQRTMMDCDPRREERPIVVKNRPRRKRPTQI